MELTEKLQAAGVVGCGGAGFPTHIKLGAKVEYFIVNGAECEPLLRTDRYLMKHKATQLIQAAEAAAKQVQAGKAVIALKETYLEEISCLVKAITERNSFVELFLLENFYPAGDEQVVVYEVTGRVIPPGGLPFDVGAVVSNVATMCAAYDALFDIPLTHKYITVSGNVKEPVILRVPVGTSVVQCIEEAKPVEPKYSFILGGPLMGKVFPGEEAEAQTITKTTSGVLVIESGIKPEARQNVAVGHMLKQAKSACIQCSYCTQLCPRHLLGHPLRPHMIMRKLAYNTDIEELLSDQEVTQALICSECGVCEEYACPMGLQPRRINKLLKSILSKEGIKYRRGAEPPVPDEMREYRKVPSKRLAARLELAKYYDYKVDRFCELTPSKVEIALKQHVGAPAVPVVEPGQAVKEGQLIAECAANVVGANIHASITGTVKAVSQAIIIER